MLISFLSLSSFAASSISSFFSMMIELFSFAVENLGSASPLLNGSGTSL